MSAHTPGTWCAVGTWVEHVDDDRADICTCDPRAMNQGHLGRSYKEMCANARLLATAPQLLRFAKHVVRMRGQLGPGDLATAQAVINAAEGKA